MEIKFVLVSLPSISEILTQHLLNLSSPVDTFFESHVERSNHYHIFVDGVKAGYTSIHENNLVTQFFLFDSFKKYGQPIFQQVKKLEMVQQAFVPTCDEFFLAHALDTYRRLEIQAYFFQHGNEDLDANKLISFSHRLAQVTDIEYIRHISGDFFEPIAQKVEDCELFITNKDNDIAGIGVIVKSIFREHVSDIGMFTIESFRNTGVGTATIQLLIQECLKNGQQIVAGCWYYNHLSKRTLEKAGMYSQTRLLKFSF